MPDIDVELIQAIDQRVKQVHTQSLDLSFNELLDMHSNQELNISPDFQRLFQWSEGAQSRFIESLLLEMPVPPIYVVEEDNGTYMLIDGLQRISSYLHFRGRLEAAHLDPPVAIGEFLTLVDCDIVMELNGKQFNNLGLALQIRLKRAFVRVEVVRKGSDAQFKYHMFKRLNTGGQLLSEQQIRNCTIRLLDPTFNDFIIELSDNASFKTCTETITSERRLAAFDQELVLRFFALKNNIDAFRHDVADFLTEYMEAIARHVSDFNYIEERACFDKTFRVLELALGDLAFAFAVPGKPKLSKGFSVYHFEAFTLGIQDKLPDIDVTEASEIAHLKGVLNDIKQNPDFIAITRGGGRNSPGPLKARIDFVKQQVS